MYNVCWRPRATNVRNTRAYARAYRNKELCNICVYLRIACVRVYGFPSARRSSKSPPFPCSRSFSVGRSSSPSPYEHSLESIRERNGVAVHRGAAASLFLCLFPLLSLSIVLLDGTRWNYRMNWKRREGRGFRKNWGKEERKEGRKSGARRRGVGSDFYVRLNGMFLSFPAHTNK